jgi:hypothetical protein
MTGKLEIGGDHAHRSKYHRNQAWEWLRGSAQGPLGLGALLLITVLVAASIFGRRNPP